MCKPYFKFSILCCDNALLMVWLGLGILFFSVRIWKRSCYCLKCLVLSPQTQMEMSRCRLKHIEWCHACRHWSVKSLINKYWFHRYKCWDTVLSLLYYNTVTHSAKMCLISWFAATNKVDGHPLEMINLLLFTSVWNWKKSKTENSKDVETGRQGVGLDE